MIVILDRQHVGKPGSDDRGASTEIDGVEIWEVDLTAQYIEEATALLVAEGHTVHLLDSAHVNAGGGAYGLVLHDQRSRGGQALAEAIADSLDAGARPHIDRCVVRATERGGTWGRAHTTIAGIWDAPSNCSGVCFEPFFIDSARNRELLTPPGLALVGRALAVGCMQWAMN